MSTEPPPGTQTATKSPILQLSAQDHGAETLRNYRYQSAYAVVLLIAAAAKKNDYKSVWCEQEDDVLCQIDDNIFDACQVKTKKSELGAWRVTDDSFIKSVKIWLRIDKDYPGSIRQFHFVSNTECLESDAKGVKHLCPKRLAKAAKACSSSSDLPESEQQGFDALLKETGGSEEALFNVLRRIGFVRTPDRDSFIAELAQNHLRELDWCQLPQPRLEIVVRSLIEMADSASSLSAQDPARHYPVREKRAGTDPQLLAKQITVEAFILRSRELAGSSFRYLPSLTTSPLANKNKDLIRFKSKLNRGGLNDYADSLRNQLLSAEAIFLDLATRGPDGQAQLSQIENVVKAECDAAHLRAAQGATPFGQRMLIEVQDRLKALAKEDPAKAGKQPYEVLMGMAGLLTEACPVWWSERFDMEEQP